MKSSSSWDAVSGDWQDSSWVLIVTPAGAGLVPTDALGGITAVRSIDAGVRLGGAHAERVPFTHWYTGGDGGLYLRGIVLVAAQLVGINNDRVISFTPDGGSSGGRLVLRGGDRQVAIGVDWLTGRVVVR